MRTGRLLIIVTAAGLLAAAGQAQENRFEAEIRAFEEADRESPPPKGGVVFTGSSSIRMWTSLEEAFPRLPVINRGFGGSEIADAIIFFERIVLPHRPRMVVLYAGDNDIAGGKSPGRVFADFRRFARMVHETLPDTRILYISIKPSIAREQHLATMKDANERIQRYASDREWIDYVDVFTPMLDAEGRPRSELFLDDGLHLNEAGYNLWQEILEPYLRTL